jgi:hypothetical protein
MSLLCSLAAFVRVLSTASGLLPWFWRAEAISDRAADIAALALNGAGAVLVG